MIGFILSKKIVFSTLTSAMYTAGGGGVVWWALGLGGEEGNLVRDAKAPEYLPRRELRIKRKISTLDRAAYLSDREHVEIEGTKLPSYLVETNLYQADDSRALENGTTKFYCTNRMFEDYINWESKRGSINTVVDKVTGKEPVSGCVDFIWWKEWYGDRWRGGWRMMSVTRNSDYATMMLTTLEADMGGFAIEGSLYTLKKQGNRPTDKWDIIGYMKTDTKEITEENKEDLWITPGDSFDKEDDIHNNWGGFDLNAENVCTESECYGDSDRATWSHGLWYIMKDAKMKDQKEVGSLDNWSNNYDKWSKALFPGYIKQHHKAIKGYLGKYWGYKGETNDQPIPSIEKLKTEIRKS